MTVKLTFEKSEHGDKIIITKDGGFTVDDMSRITEVVEDIFNEDEGEEETEEEDSEEEGEEEQDEEQDKSKQSASGDGRGKPAGETPEGLKVRKDGEIDGRSLRSRRSPEELKDEPFVKNLEKASKESGRGTDHAR